MKLYIILCIVFSYQQLFTFPWFNFIKESSLYCSIDELNLLFYNQIGFDKLYSLANKNDQARLQKLQHKKHKLFWHIDDPSIGLVQKNNFPCKSLAWNFSLWDLAPQKGRGCKIALIDNLKNNERFNLNKLHRFSLNLKDNKENLIDNDLHSEMSKGLLEGNLKDDFLGFKKSDILQNHGYITCGIIKQLAPYVNIVSIQAVNKKGYASSENFYNALKSAKDQKYDFVHLGLKVNSKEEIAYREPIRQLINQIPYIVAASGNDTSNNEAFPASIETVPFDVGAFSFDYQVCSFSQYKEAVGPKVLAPGEDILCPYGESSYVMMSGTSIAAAIITGFLSLVLAEFQDHFTYDQIIFVVYQSTYKQEWFKKSLLGIIDMRSCLFCFHVLLQFQKLLSKKKFKKHFSKITRTTYLLLRLSEMCLVEKDGDEQVFGSFVNSFNAYARCRVGCGVKFFVMFIAQMHDIRLRGLDWGKRFDMPMVKLVKDSIDLKKGFVGEFSASVWHRLECAINK